MIGASHTVGGGAELGAQGAYGAAIFVAAKQPDTAVSCLVILSLCATHIRGVAGGRGTETEVVLANVDGFAVFAEKHCGGGIAAEGCHRNCH